ncbi:cortical protein marker for cell polarity-domain-containing protein [Thamnidium elegans]|nr:cortical protein marker for cell polarity-domain-containing protein [Thamnidium elegans]
MIFCSCLLLLLFNIVQASYVTHPNINFDPLQQIGISGSYNGISLYKDTAQLTTLKQSTSSVISLSNDTLQLLASSNVNGVIYDTCIFNNNMLVFGGNFTTLNNKNINNIASIDLTTKELKPLLNGLDGPVNTVYCDTNAIYVGGSFIAPSTPDMISYSKSLSQFGGSVALWKDNKWNGLPWKGLNGPVYSIIKNKEQIIFGGKFDTTTDGQTFYAPASQPISLPATGVTATSGANPSAILCASSSWLLDEGVKGTWQTSFITYNVNPSLVRIQNSKVENRQTKEFSIRSLTNATLNFSLAYLDPVTGIAKTCKDNCTLSNDPSVTYQDFRILNTFMTSGIAIDIKSWYGVGGGLSFVQVFQSEIFTYAVDQNVANACTANFNRLNATTTGTWIPVSASSSPYLSHKITGSSDTSSVTLYPNIAEPGIYELLVYTPVCESSNCAERTDVNVIISNSPTTNTSTVTMSQRYPGSRSIYTGYFDYSSTFEPSIILTRGKNATTSGTSYLVAFAVQLVKSSSDYTLSSLLQYNPTQTNISSTNLAWKALPDTVPYNSIVKTMQLSSNGDMYIGGTFSGIDKTNKRYNNIIRYDSAAKQLKPLTGYGLNGAVNSIDVTPTEVFVGGNFTALSNTTSSNVKDLTYVARYDIKKETWSALNAGVNGPVKSIHALSNSILVSGGFNQLVKSNTDTYPTAASGNAWWDSQKNQWTVDSTVPFLSGNVYSALTHNKENYFTGNITAAQRYQSNGISFMTSMNTFSFPSFYPDSTQASMTVSAGVLFDGNSGVSESNIVQNTTSTTIFGGVFSLPNNIKNIALYHNNNNTWSGLQGADWTGQISTMTVNNDLLYVGGRFKGSISNNFAVFSLSNKSLSLNPNVQTSDGSPASVNVIRHIPTQNSMIVGGHFGTVGSLPCSSICALNTGNMQWNNLGSGLIGEVYDFLLIDEKLVTTGNLSLNDSPIHIAQFDFKKNTWGPFDTANLPGPSRALSYDNLTNHLYISGETDKTSNAYLRIWDGHQFNLPAVELGPGSVISKMTMLPATNDTSKQNVLLATGFINLGELGNVSAAFYDGQAWIPYLVTSGANGDSVASLSSLFFLDQPYIATVIKKYLATPLVILVAIAVSLGIVFLIVLGAMIIISVKRKRDAKVNPQSSPSAYYGKSPRTPQSLLTMLKETSPDDKNSDDDDLDTNNHSIEKMRNLEPGTQQFYNMSKSISTDHLHEQPLTPFNGAAAMTTARAAPAPPTAHSRSISSQNALYNMPHAPAAAAIVGVGAMAAGAARPESYTRPISEYQRDTDSFYNNNYAVNYNREMAEVPGRQSPYNPFRNSEIGVALGGGAAAAGGTGLAHAASAFSNENNRNITPNNTGYNNTNDSAQPIGEAASYTGGSSSTGMNGVAMAGAAVAGAGIASAFTNNNNRNINPNNGGYNPAQHTGEAVSYSNIPVTGSASAGAVLASGTRGMPSNSSPYKQEEHTTSYGNVPPPTPSHFTVGSPGAVRWTTAPVEQASYAVVDHMSMVGHSDGSSLLDPISGPQATRSMNNNTAAENVRWTNAPSSQNALATAVISTAAPTIAVHASEDSEYHSQQDYQNSSSPSFIPNRNTNDSALASNVQWTHQNANAALGVAKIEPDTRDSAYHDHGSFYSPVPTNVGSTSNHSLLNTTLDTTTEGFSSDPDFARWTTAPAANVSTAKIEPVEPVDNRSATSLGRPQYQASLSVPEWPQDEYEEEEHSLNVPQDRLTDLPSDLSFSDDVNTNVMHKNAFRLSDAGSLPPIDTSMFSKNVPIGISSPEELMSPDSAVRWKNANVASPIETAYAPKIHAPATATVTRRSTDEEKPDAFEDYYNPKPQAAVTGPSSATASKSKYKPVANTQKTDSPVKEPIGRKSETIDDAIAKRDLNALSMIIQGEEEEPSNPFYNTTPIPTNPRKEPLVVAAAAGAGAMDGRASSKRMVEEYISSRNNKPVDDTKDKKSKYRSDFKSVMATAVLNNTKFPVATEDNPHLYYAKFDFSAREHGELGFEKANPIIVVDSSDDIWWMGYKADKSDGSYIQGVFPSNYVEIATDLR